MMGNKQHYDKMKTILDKIDKVVHDIKIIKIQGATNIAIAAFKVLKEEIQLFRPTNKDELYDLLKTGISMLVNARPTEPMLFNGMRYAIWSYRNNLDKDLDTLQNIIVSAFDEVLDLISQGDDIRSKVGAELIKPGYKVITHCHSGSVVKVIKKAWEGNKDFEMFNTETRPLFQGRITAKDLLKIGVSTTLITDDMGPYFIDNTTPDTPNINMMIIGCDAIKRDGSVINKVGSFGMALSAWHSGVPVYVVGSLTKFDVEDSIHIELRDGKEIWPDAPDSIRIKNFAFDTVPAKFITGIITRFGVVAPENIALVVEENYPWMDISLDL